MKGPTRKKNAIMSGNGAVLTKDQLDGETDKASYALNGQKNDEHAFIEKRSVNEKDLTPNPINVLMKCPLVVSQKSRDKFQKRVLHDNANSLMLTLNLPEIV